MMTTISDEERKLRYCRQCGQPFHVFRFTTYSDGRPAPARSGSIHGMDIEGTFCTLRCAARYGVAQARAGALMR